jgi:Papain family cysteine protease
MVKKVLIFLAAFVAIALSQLDGDFELNLEAASDFEADLGFASWAMNTGLDLSSVSDQLLLHYQENYNLNAQIVSNINKANLTFKTALNSFSHLNGAEFEGLYCGVKVPPTARSLPTPPAAPAFGAYTKANVPAAIDYTCLMQPVLNQGGCGSCWAFATLGMLEGWQKKKSSLWANQLAPQYLVDCDTLDNKCNGGWPRNTLNWIKTNSALKVPLLKNYAYTGRGIDVCNNATAKATLTFSNIYQWSLNNDEDQLKVYLANYGPLAIAMQVNSASGLFQNYRGGIFYDPGCPVTTPTVNQCSKVNHGMVLVGYGTALGVPYWLIKNSWGK